MQIQRTRYKKRKKDTCRKEEQEEQRRCRLRSPIHRLRLAARTRIGDEDDLGMRFSLGLMKRKESEFELNLYVY